jgi:hypothetical protein
MQASFLASAELSGISLFSRLTRPFQSAAKADDERVIVAGYQETLAQVQETDFSASYNLLSGLR